MLVWKEVSGSGGRGYWGRGVVVGLAGTMDGLGGEKRLY